MSKLALVIIVTALSCVLFVGGSVGQVRKKNTRSRPLAGGECGGWPPEKESALYAYTRQLSLVDKVEINELRLTADSGVQTKVIKFHQVSNA